MQVAVACFVPRSIVAAREKYQKWLIKPGSYRDDSHDTESPLNSQPFDIFP